MGCEVAYKFTLRRATWSKGEPHVDRNPQSVFEDHTVMRSLLRYTKTGMSQQFGG